MNQKTPTQMIYWPLHQIELPHKHESKDIWQIGTLKIEHKIKTNNYKITKFKI